MNALILYMYNVGQVHVGKVECQGYGDKLYCNDGGIRHADGSVTYENWVLFREKPTPEQIAKLRAGKKKPAEGKALEGGENGNR